MSMNMCDRIGDQKVVRRETHPNFGFVTVQIGYMEEYAVEVGHRHVGRLRLQPETETSVERRFAQM